MYTEVTGTLLGTHPKCQLQSEMYISGILPAMKCQQATVNRICQVSFPEM